MFHAIAVVGARLNSSRLPGKHLLDLAGAPLISRIFERLDQVPELQHAILATTADTYNQPLVDWAAANGRNCYAHHGDVNDLMGRVDAVYQREKPDLLVYVCGDSPLIEPGFISRVIAGLRDHPEAEAVVVETLQGRHVIHEGIDIYTARYWKRLIAASRLPHEREHVGSARGKLGSVSTLSLREPEVFYAEHRLSVDTPSDYRFMGEVYGRWQRAFPEQPVVDLAWVIEQLAQDPELRAINTHVRQKTVHQQSVPMLVVCEVGPRVGLGHLNRALVVVHALQDHLSAAVRLLIVGEPLSFPGLATVPHRFVPELSAGIEEQSSLCLPKAIVFDLPKHASFAGLRQLRQKGVVSISIDYSLVDGVDLQWVPCFFDEAGKGCFGWQNYLLRPAHKALRRSNHLLVLSGGGDIYGMGRQLPQLLADAMGDRLAIHWIQGPFAASPRTPSSGVWHCHLAPDSMAVHYREASFAIAAYGTSLFEALAHGIPTIAYTPDGDKPEYLLFDQAGVALRAVSKADILSCLKRLLDDAELVDSLSSKALALLDGNGPQRFAKAIARLISGDGNS